MSPSLSFTGERFLPECGGEIWYEHWHRYALASGLCTAQTAVLDVASGEGYGSAMLAQHAGRVVGVDISAEAVRHAHARYAGQTNLEYITASCDTLPLADASFDLAVSFETIEHIATQKEFMAELARVLRSNGLLIISSPNKRIYSDAVDFHNEFHVRELYREEFEDLLREHFPHIAWFGQKLLFHSAIWPEDTVENAAECLTDGDGVIAAESRPPVEAMYFIAVCSRNPVVLPDALKKLSLFSDRAESIYQDYIRQTRRVIELDGLLKQRERLIEERDALLQTRTVQFEDQNRRLAEQGHRLEEQALKLTALGKELDARAKPGWLFKLPLLIIRNFFRKND